MIGIKAELGDDPKYVIITFWEGREDKSKQIFRGKITVTQFSWSILKKGLRYIRPAQLILEDETH